MSDDAAPEHWSADAGERDVARLEIPPHASRERGFEIYCSLAVKAQGFSGMKPWLTMTSEPAESSS